MKEIQFIFLNKNKGRYVLNYNPIGWDTTKMTLKRSSKYHGIDIEFSEELQFVKDGKAYIDEVYESEGYQGEIEVIIQERIENSTRYETIHTGLINFTKYIKEEVRTKVNIEQSGLKTRFNNSDDLDVDLLSTTALQGEILPPLSNFPVQIPMHSKSIDKEYHAKMSLSEPSRTDSPIVDNAGARTATFYFGFSEILRNDLGAFTYGTGFNFDDEKMETVRSREKGRFEIFIKLKSELRCDLKNGDFDKASIGFFFAVNDTVNNRQDLYYHQQNPVNGDFSEVMEFQATMLRDINIGDKIYLWGEIKAEDVAGSYEFQYAIMPHMAECEIHIKAATQTEETQCNGLLNYEAGARLLQSITGQQESFHSEFLGRTDSSPKSYEFDGQGSMLLLTNGGQIRNFPLDKVPITTSFKDWFESNSAVYNLGAGFEVIEGKQQLRVEPKSYFYSSEIGLKIGRVSKLRKSLAREYIYNSVEVGYSKWQKESEGGYDEFNTKRTYTLPVTQVKNAYSALSKYTAAGYAIEAVRREQYAEFPTKDSSDDKQIFFICVSKDNGNYETERDENFALLQNVKSPDTIYNARISPARMLLNHCRDLVTCLLHQRSKSIRFTTGEANVEMASRLYSEANVLYEDGDVAISNIPNPISLPNIYEFECALSAQQIKFLKQNPYKIITFEDENSETRFGHLLEVKTSKGSPCEFKLLEAYN